MPNISPQRPNPKNQVRGMINRAQGKCFEDLIEQSCAWYLQMRIAKIKKTPEPFHIIRNIGNGKFIGNFVKQAQPDFQGSIAGGCSVVFDAKSTQTDRIKQSEVTKQQWEDLNDHKAMGAECFILVSFRMELFFAVPWETWRHMKELYDRKYMEVDDLIPFEVPFDGMKIDFLRRKQ